jgi:hypothetical protein
MYCRLYSVSRLTCTAASGSTEADNDVLQTVQCQYAHLYRCQWQQLTMMFCRLYSVSMLTCTAASGFTEADNDVLQTVPFQYAHLYRSQWQHRS